MLRVLPLLLLAAPPGFWEHWGDGRGELSGYALTQHRYGQSRQGRATMVVVTETFSQALRVKADPGRHPPADELPVIKLNLNESFQAGVYDYNVMTSVFARVEPGQGMSAGAPLKQVFSSQEWCGQVFEAWWWGPGGRVMVDRHSYFDGEADQRSEQPWGDAFTADELFLAVRGLGRPVPAEIMLLPRAKETRFLHKPGAPVHARVVRTRVAGVAVPAGTFDVEEVRVTRADGVDHVFQVEVAAPRRLVSWEVTGQERALLQGSARDAYWEHNRVGDEKLLGKMGLSPRGP